MDDEAEAEAEALDDETATMTSHKQSWSIIQLHDDASKNDFVEHEYNLENGSITSNGYQMYIRSTWVWKIIPGFLKFHDVSVPIEATGLANDMFARSTVYMAVMYLGPAMMDLATLAAQQNANCYNDTEKYVDIDTLEQCLQNAKIYGFRPSSLLTNIGTIVGLASAAMAPFFGAIVDHTPYRFHAGAITAGILTFVKILELSISINTWLLISFLQIVSGVAFQMHNTTVYAYSSELSKKPGQQSKYQSYFTVIGLISMLVFLLAILIPSILLGFGSDSVATAKFAIIVTCIVTIIMFPFTWSYLFQNRPPLSAIPIGQSLWSAGLYKLLKTCRETLPKQAPATQWLLLSITFSESANSALATIATTIMSQYLRMTPTEIGVALLLVLISAIPGSYVGNYFATRSGTNPLQSVKLCLLSYIFSTLGASLWLRPEHKDLVYIFAALWGICQGWLHPQNIATFVCITPQHGSTAELMGLFLFACQFFAWAPPMTYSILNEQGVAIYWGIASLNLYFFIALVLLHFMGSFDAAVQQATQQPGQQQQEQV